MDVCPLALMLLSIQLTSIPCLPFMPIVLQALLQGYRTFQLSLTSFKWYSESPAQYFQLYCKTSSYFFIVQRTEGRTRCYRRQEKWQVKAHAKLSGLCLEQTPEPTAKSVHFPTFFFFSATVLTFTEGCISTYTWKFMLTFGDFEINISIVKSR